MDFKPNKRKSTRFSNFSKTRESLELFQAVEKSFKEHPELELFQESSLEILKFQEFLSPTTQSERNQAHSEQNRIHQKPCSNISPCRLESKIYNDRQNSLERLFQDASNPNYENRLSDITNVQSVRQAKRDSQQSSSQERTTITAMQPISNSYPISGDSFLSMAQKQIEPQLADFSHFRTSSSLHRYFTPNFAQTSSIRPSTAPSLQSEPFEGQIDRIKRKLYNLRNTTCTFVSELELSSLSSETRSLESNPNSSSSVSLSVSNPLDVSSTLSTPILPMESDSIAVAVFASTPIGSKTRNQNKSRDLCSTDESISRAMGTTDESNISNTSESNQCNYQLPLLKPSMFSVTEATTFTSTKRYSQEKGSLKSGRLPSVPIKRKTPLDNSLKSKSSLQTIRNNTKKMTAVKVSEPKIVVNGLKGSG